MTNFVQISARERWDRFVQFHAKHWHGIWTRYNPDGSILEWFPSERILIPTTDGLRVNHTNHEKRSSQVNTKNWLHEFSGKKKNFEFPTVTYCLPNGALLWTTPRFTGNNILNDEFFFRFGDSTRCSVTTLYNTKGELYRVTNIREFENGVPTPWSSQTALETERQVPQVVLGEGYLSDCVTGEAKVCSAEIPWPASEKGRREFYIPDGISVSCPLKVDSEDEMLIVIDVPLPSGQHQRERIRYPSGWKWPEYTVVIGMAII